MIGKGQHVDRESSRHTSALCHCVPQASCLDSMCMVAFLGSHPQGACLQLNPAVVEAACAAAQSRVRDWKSFSQSSLVTQARGGETPPWVQDAQRVLWEMLGCACRLATWLGPRSSRLFVVEWQGGASGSGEGATEPAAALPDGIGFGFLSEEEPLDAVAPEDVPRLQGGGVCVFVDASEMSSNEPHVLSAWAVVLLERVQQQYGTVAVVRYTEWAGLAGAASKAKFMAQRAQHMT